MASRAPLQLSGAFGLGALLCALIFAPVLFPVPVYRAWCALAHDGAIPSSLGVLSTLRAPRPGEAGPGPGPWVVLELRDLSARAQPVATLDRFGAELGFEVTAPDGKRVASVLAPATASQATWVHTTLLAPGGRLGLVCDLSRWVRLEGPGPYVVRAERIALEARPHSRTLSNAIRVSGL